MSILIAVPSRTFRAQSLSPYSSVRAAVHLSYAIRRTRARGTHAETSETAATVTPVTGCMTPILQKKVADERGDGRGDAGRHPGDRDVLRLDFPTMRNHPERHPELALWAMRRGLPMGRPLTDLERMALAVASCRPTHHLTITSALAERSEFLGAFAALKKRITRRRARPLIYVGTVANGLGDAGYHAHLLLWGYQHLRILKGEARAVGLGHLHIERVRQEPYPAIESVLATTYVLGQEQPVFGSGKYLDNKARARSKRRFLMPQRQTLAEHRPQLLAALDVAIDPTVPDDALLSFLPSLDIEDNPETP